MLKAARDEALQTEQGAQNMWATRDTWAAERTLQLFC